MELCSIRRTPSASCAPIADAQNLMAGDKALDPSFADGFMRNQLASRFIQAVGPDAVYLCITCGSVSTSHPN
jgi:hypothetical protein